MHDINFSFLCTQVSAQHEHSQWLVGGLAQRTYIKVGDRLPIYIICSCFILYVYLWSTPKDVYLRQHVIMYLLFTSTALNKRATWMEEHVLRELYYQSCPLFVGADSFSGQSFGLSYHPEKQDFKDTSQLSSNESRHKWFDDRDILHS